MSTISTVMRIDLVQVRTMLAATEQEAQAIHLKHAVAARNYEGMHHFGSFLGTYPAGAFLAFFEHARSKKSSDTEHLCAQ